METSPRTKSAHKLVKSQSAVQSGNAAARGGVRYSPPHQAIKSPSWSRDEVKERHVEKSKVSQKTPVKENTKSQDFKLHTQERAVKRAMFNYEMIEEEEVRMLRKEMIPRAQLMPFFDKPFFPQRSNRRSTVPREPSSHMIGSKCSSSSISCS
ncbi:hypothetical protein RHSIM_Rhsim08G0020300 [Rhododendron simsii]|uniref:TPX2 C-terminal domain-containing protein n=1 Tax=Rhododendron simsii TaxID=118357 RepID=A0A834LDP5_RHOSS|nr:hypothetical protein RHSIM_Rhsim08G0020300 [Rhododendron simsii]